MRIMFSFCFFLSFDIIFVHRMIATIMMNCLTKKEAVLLIEE